MFTCRPWFMLVFALLFAGVGPGHAEEEPPAYSSAQLGAIREAQIRVSENHDAAHDGDVTHAAADARIVRIMARLNADLPTGLTEVTLMEINIPNVMPRMTSADREEGFFAGVNFLRLGPV